MTNATHPNDAGFTLTELIAGMLVATLLIAGVVDIIRQYARTTQHVRTVTKEVGSAIVLSALLDELERADPDTVVVSASQIRASIGDAPVSATISNTLSGALFQWSSPIIARAIPVPKGARFERSTSGVITLWGKPGDPPLANVTPQRTTPFDCQFDTISLECRR